MKVQNLGMILGAAVLLAVTGTAQAHDNIMNMKKLGSATTTTTTKTKTMSCPTSVMLSVSGKAGDMRLVPISNIILKSGSAATNTLGVGVASISTDKKKLDCSFTPSSTASVTVMARRLLPHPIHPLKKPVAGAAATPVTAPAPLACADLDRSATIKSSSGMWKNDSTTTSYAKDKLVLLSSTANSCTYKITLTYASVVSQANNGKPAFTTATGDKFSVTSTAKPVVKKPVIKKPKFPLFGQHMVIHKPVKPVVKPAVTTTTTTTTTTPAATTPAATTPAATTPAATTPAATTPAATTP